MLQQQASQGLAFGAVGNHEQTNYPLTLSVSLGQRLELQFAYDREHFDDASVARLDRHLTHLLAQMVERPASTCLAEFQLLEAAERRQAIFDWGATRDAIRTSAASSSCSPAARRWSPSGWHCSSRSAS